MISCDDAVALARPEVQTKVRSQGDSTLRLQLGGAISQRFQDPDVRFDPFFTIHRFWAPSLRLENAVEAAFAKAF